MGGKVQGLKSIIGRYKTDKGMLRIVYIGNGEAKELICTTYAHELRVWGIAGGKGAYKWTGAKGEKLGQL